MSLLASVVLAELNHVFTGTSQTVIQLSCCFLSYKLIFSVCSRKNVVYDGNIFSKEWPDKNIKVSLLEDIGEEEDNEDKDEECDKISTF